MFNEMMPMSLGGGLNFSKGQIALSTTKTTYPLDFKPKMVAIVANNINNVVGMWFYDMSNDTPTCAYKNTTTANFTVDEILQWNCEMELLDSGFTFKLGSATQSWVSNGYYVAVG